ncbi:Uncharacterised protein [Escherichia coli]|nr:hypothetical protein G932_02174 [Escherichia coli UMEA 3178-1]KLX59993.1 hypothetical protein SK78_01081 [Escherichia coli]OMI50006.1 hypothetical protein MP35_21595 [Escherichia coli N40513]GDD75357.1 hypothetical protein HmCmsJML204_00936 [Escherichia coli]SRB69552.1 Uncharacterised protein [Escherichia coli]
MFLFPKIFNIAMKSKLLKILNKKPEGAVDNTGAFYLKGNITYTR